MIKMNRFYALLTLLVVFPLALSAQIRRPRVNQGPQRSGVYGVSAAPVSNVNVDEHGFILPDGWCSVEGEVKHGTSYEGEVLVKVVLTPEGNGKEVPYQGEEGRSSDGANSFHFYVPVHMNISSAKFDDSTEARLETAMSYSTDEIPQEQLFGDKSTFRIPRFTSGAHVSPIESCSQYIDGRLTKIKLGYAVETLSFVMHKEDLHKLFNIRLSWKDPSMSNPEAAILKKKVADNFDLITQILDSCPELAVNMLRMDKMFPQFDWRYPTLQSGIEENFNSGNIGEAQEQCTSSDLGMVCIAIKVERKGSFTY